MSYVVEPRKVSARCEKPYEEDRRWTHETGIVQCLFRSGGRVGRRR